METNKIVSFLVKTSSVFILKESKKKSRVFVSMPVVNWGF